MVNEARKGARVKPLSAKKTLDIAEIRLRLRFAWLDQRQEMQLAGIVSGDNRPPVWRDSATHQRASLDDADLEERSLST